MSIYVSLALDTIMTKEKAGGNLAPPLLTDFSCGHLPLLMHTAFRSCIGPFESKTWCQG
jgi:hypothetical protein